MHQSSAFAWGSMTRILIIVALDFLFRIALRVSRLFFLVRGIGLYRAVRGRV
jgi:hypothetical protein